MATAATRGRGTKLQMQVGTPYVTIAEVLDISGPTLARSTIDVTNHDSAADYREFITGTLDGGEVTFDVNYLPADPDHDATTGLIAVFESGAITNFKLIFTDSGTTTWDFAGLVVGFEVSAAIEDQLKASCTIKLSGQPTLV